MTWTVRALKPHTYKGVAYVERQIYTVTEADALVLEAQLRSLEEQGMAHRVDPADNLAVT